MSHNVLVVDDEPKLCDLLSSALSQTRTTGYTASSPHRRPHEGRTISV